MEIVKSLPFSEYIKRKDHLSNHQLVHLDDCPATFQYFLTAPLDPPTADQIEGSCFDIAVFNLDLFKQVVIRDGSRKTIAETKDKGYLLGWERYDRLIVMAENTLNHPQISKILATGNFQVSVFTELGEVKVKSRPDFLPDHLPIIVDFKTTRVTPSPRNLRNESARYKYYRQAAFYLDQQPDRKAFVLVWVPKTAPYLPVVEEVVADTLQFGRWEYKKLLELYKDCTKTGIWAGHWQVRRHQIPKCVMLEAGYVEEEVENGAIPDNE